MSILVLFSSQTPLLYVSWITFQLLVLHSFTGRTKGLGKDETEICKFDELNQSDMMISEGSNRIIYLLTLLPYPSDSNANRDNQQTLATDMGPALLLAAELAVDHINQDPHILHGYKVKLINADGGCQMPTTALISFVKHVFDNENEERPITGIIGLTCSEPTIAVSSIIGRGGLALPNVHIASSAELEDRNKYPYTFGVVGSTFQLVDALFSLIRYNGWNKVAILYDESRASVSLYAYQRLKEEIRSHNIYHLPMSDTFFPLESLIISEVRIGIIISSLALVRKWMCIMYCEGMTFPDYQWIIAEHSYRQFTENNNNTTFSYRRIPYECFWSIHNTALNYAIFVHFRLSEVDKSLSLLSGLTYDNITVQYETKIDFHKRNKLCPFPVVPKFMQAATTYDAVWALVLALNMSTSVISVSSGVSPSDTISKLSKDKFPDVNFRGASGHINIDKTTGFVQRLVEIDQVYNSIPIPVGLVHQGHISLYTDPRIRYITTFQPRYASVNPILTAFFVLVELTLILGTAVVHIVTLLNQKYPSIKASSPCLNQFIFLACYIWGGVAIIYTLILKALGLPDFDFIGNSCHAIFVWLIPIVITLSFGMLTAKTWRIYRIFIHFRQPGPLISNKALLMMMLIQLSIDIIIATAWTIISPVILVAIEEDSYVNENGEAIIPRMCVYTNPAVWVTIVLGYKTLQVLALLILCVMTRSIRNKKFSTKSLKVASYLCLLLIAIPLPIYGILWYTNAEIHADFIVFCVSFCAFGFTLLVLVVLPPVLPLFMQRFSRRYR